MVQLRTPLVSALLVLACVGCGSAELEAKVGELETQLQEAQTLADASEAAKTNTEAQLEETKAKLATLEETINDQATKILELESTKGSLEGELQKKEAALAAMKQLQDALAKSLVEEIETGEISVSERGGFLVVDVSDKVLFATGQAELSERGQKVITKLADSLKELPRESVFQVGGHTDNQAIKSEEVKARFPTNWELSAARATNVVRFLEETCEVPGERLVAAGFSQYRPVASNKKERQRAKNRRIEIALLPPRK